MESMIQAEQAAQELTLTALEQRISAATARVESLTRSQTSVVKRAREAENFARQTPADKPDLYLRRTREHAAEVAQLGRIEQELVVARQELADAETAALQPRARAWADAATKLAEVVTRIEASTAEAVGAIATLLIAVSSLRKLSASAEQHRRAMHGLHDRGIAEIESPRHNYLDARAKLDELLLAVAKVRPEQLAMLRSAVTAQVRARLGRDDVNFAELAKSFAPPAAY
jgi:chromosome segregation ATPase